MLPIMKRRSPRSAPSPRPTPALRDVELTIAELGALGDGIATFDGRAVYVPQSVPGDRLRVGLGDRRGDGIEGVPRELLAAGPDRVPPPCPHFGACGGCRMQHVAEPAYRHWKAALIREALDKRGLAEVAVAPLVAIPPGTRRRATFAARRGTRGVYLGFTEYHGHRIIDLEVCEVLRPELVALLPGLRALLLDLLAESEPADIAVALLDDGIDLLIAAGRAPDLAARERLAAFAEAADLARVSWRSDRGPAEPIAHRRTGVVRFGGVPVTVPPGGFLQASREGEAALTRHVLAAVGSAGRVADLFAGTGTFTFPLSGGPCGQGGAPGAITVTAIDQNAEAVAAIHRAARQSGLVQRLAIAVRDLMHDPLTPNELAKFDAVVLDPPRQGARAQAAALALSRVPAVVMVSCDPGSFARDARLLVDGGYRPEPVTPIDQFLWSAQIELAGVFRR